MVKLFFMTLLTLVCFVNKSVFLPNTGMSGKKNKGTVLLKPLLKSYAGFNFSTGNLVHIDGPDDFPKVDLVWDYPGGGLGANNSDLAKPFTGKGGIVDMGKKKIAEVQEAPLKGYVSAIDSKEIKVGHTYCLKTAGGKNYGKFEIIKFDTKKGELELLWQYQPKILNKFD